MRKLIPILAFASLISCAPKVTAVKGEKPLYEVLTTQIDGGANIRFYEILSEPQEIKMLLGDENLRNKIDSDDTQNANFIILNMGEKPTSGYSIAVESVQENADKIIVTVKETVPPDDAMNATVITHPYTIVKINSKKPIEIK